MVLMSMPAFCAKARVPNMPNLRNMLKFNHSPSSQSSCYGLRIMALPWPTDTLNKRNTSKFTSQPSKPKLLLWPSFHGWPWPIDTDNKHSQPVGVDLAGATLWLSSKPATQAGAPRPNVAFQAADSPLPCRSGGYPRRSAQSLWQ
jgi:hypothetical protein